MDDLREELKKIPPHQNEAEQSVLGGILQDNDTLSAALEILQGDEFYREAHRAIFRAVLELFERNEPVDLVTVADLLAERNALEKAGGPVYLASLVDSVPTATNVGAYARIVHGKAVLRRLIQGANEVLSLCYDRGKKLEEVLDHAERIIFSVTGHQLRTRYSPIQEVVKANIRIIEEFQGSRKMLTGIPSGYTGLDQLTAGFQKSDLIILAARPSMGKTALALSVARNVALDHGVPVGFFSLEMSKEQLAMRLMCAEGRVDSNKIRTGFLSQQDCISLVSAAGHFMDAPIFIDDTPALTTMELRAKARRMMSEQGLGLVVVDYLQLMQSKGAESREKEISEISRSLKSLAKELGVPVMALSQLNRKVEERHDKRPQLSDLRESGSLEQDSDVVMCIYRDEVYNANTDDKGVAEILVRKQRNGPTGEVRLSYLGAYTRFENLAE